MRAALYVRVSTDEQAKHGYSIRSQKEKLEAYCVSQDWEIANFYIDEGKSAKNTERPALQKLLSDVRSGVIDVLLIYRLDRLTRSVLDLYKILEELEQYNCKFKSATEIYDTTTPTGRLFITLVAALAQWERENLVERVKVNMLKKASLGEWTGGIIPYGYRSENKKLYIVEEEAEIVREIFHLMQIHGYRKTAEILNKHHTLRGKKFAKSNVQYIANNPLYMGYMRYNDGQRLYMKSVKEQRLFKGEHEAIIDEATFWHLQDLLTKRREKGSRKVDSPFIFSSILKCDRCGSPLFGYRRTEKFKYYRCDNKSKNICDLPGIREDRIEEELITNFEKYVSQFNYHAQAKSKSVNRDFETELKDIRKKMEKYKSMFLNDLISIEELNSEIGELREKEKELEQEMNVSTPDPINEEILLNFKSLWKDANHEEKKLLLQSIFNEIKIDTTDAKRGDRNKPIYIRSVM